MKRLLLSIASVLCLSVVYAQVPTTLSYQGILVDGTGAPVADGLHYVQFGFFPAATGGTTSPCAGGCLYSSLGTGSGNTVTTYKGMFTFVIGSGSAGNIALPGNIWDSQVYIEVVADGTVLSPRIQLTTNPYAFKAENANTVVDDAITSAKIDDGTIVANDLASGAVTSAKILDSEIVNADVAAAAAIAGTKITPNFGSQNVSTTGSVTANSFSGSGASLTSLTAANISGSVAVANGGTGATTLTGMLIGNGTSAVTAVAGTSSQYLRRNAGNTAYEFATLPTDVTSVGLSMPSIFSVTGSPVTTSGTLTASLANQAVNLVFASPTGAAGVPTFRSLVPADVPNLDAGKITTGLLPIARGGTGATDAATARTNLGLIIGTDIQAPLTASNGLSLSSNVLTLGGTLSTNTTIISGGNNLLFNGTGKVGIASTTPGSKFEVGGNVGIGNGYNSIDGPANGLIVQGSTGIGTSAPTSKVHIVGDGTTETLDDMKVEGNGTTTPAFALVRTTGTFATPAVTAAGDIGQLVFNGHTGSAYITGGLIKGIAETSFTSGNVNGALTFVTAATSGLLTERMRIASTGNVGIGTTSPVSLLHTDKAGVGNYYRFTEGGTLRGLIGISGGTNDLIVGDVDNDMSIRSEANLLLGAGAAERMRITTGGNVGIGGVNPTRAVLEQYGSVGSTAAIFGGGSTGVGITANSPGIGFNMYFNVAAKAIGTGFGGNLGFNPSTGALDYSVSSASVAANANYTMNNRFSILANGNTGIGATPVNKLDVEGGAVVGAGYSGASTAPTNGLLVEGVVGIGTTTPNNGLLHLAGTASVYNAIHMTTTASGGASTDGFVVGPAGANSNELILWNNEAGNLTFGTSNATQMTINASGSVGIGATNPASTRLYLNTPSTDTSNPYALYVSNNYAGTSTKYGASINVSGDGDGIKYGVDCNVTGLAGDASTIYGLETDVSPQGTGTAYGVNSSVTAVGTGDRFGIYNNVGSLTTNTSGIFGSYNYLGTAPTITNAKIGTFNGVNGIAATTGAVYGEYNYINHSGTGTTYGVYANVTKAASQSGTVYGFYVDAGNDGTGNSYLYRGTSTGLTSGTEYGVYISGEDINYFNGQVGIGTNAPTFKLELPNLAVDATGRGRANAWSTYSDSRVKSNQRTIAYGLKEIMSLNPKSYQHHSSEFESGKLILKESASTIGLIAQEVYKVVPEAVSKPADESKDLWSMDYNKLVPVLIKATQEQQLQIEDLKSTISDLKSQLTQFKELSAQVDEIKKLLAEKDNSGGKATETGSNKK